MRPKQQVCSDYKLPGVFFETAICVTGNVIFKLLSGLNSNEYTPYTYMQNPFECYVAKNWRVYFYNTIVTGEIRALLRADIRGKRSMLFLMIILRVFALNVYVLNDICLRFRQDLWWVSLKLNDYFIIFYFYFWKERRGIIIFPLRVNCKTIRNLHFEFGRQDDLSPRVRSNHNSSRRFFFFFNNI